MEKPTISGFHSYSTSEFRGFTEQEMSILERILEKTFNHKDTQTIMKFFNDLHIHAFESPKAHEYNLTDEEYTSLIYQLFKVYRNAGNTGTVSDMLHAIGKHIEVATESDLIIGYSEVKAITNKLWNMLFHEHLIDPRAHDDLFEIVRRKFALDKAPLFTLNNILPENYTSGMTIPWHTDTGTIGMIFTYDDKVTNILTLTDTTKTQSLSFNILRKDGCYLECKLNNDILAELPLYSCATKESVVLSYTYDQWYIRTTLKEFISNQPFKRRPFATLNLGIDVKNVEIFSYYADWVDSKDAPYLLNQ